MNLAILVLLAQSIPFPGPGWKTAGTPLVIGFDFRATSGFVTDPSNTIAVIATTANYPVSCTGNQTVNCGWETAPTSTRDRDNTVDARLAGIAFNSNIGTPPCFRVDLPATGSYNIRLALGDASNSHTSNTIVFKDTTSVLLTVGPTSTSGGHFVDANSTDLTSTTWPGSNTSVSLTFTTTIFRACIGANSSDTDNSTVAYIGIGI